MQDSCHYEVHAKTAKEQMIREIHRLQRKNEHLEEQNDLLGEKNLWVEQIMQSLKTDGHGGEIIYRLKQGESPRFIAEWLQSSSVGGSPSLSPTSEHRLTNAIESYHRQLVEKPYPQHWTSVTEDGMLIEHLINLYFTWIHPTHMLFDAKNFMQSFTNCADIYCSSALVNAICAMSCLVLHNTWEDDEETRNGIYNLRGKFLEETRWLMRSADFAKMTAIQTYAVMFLVELGCGKGLSASSYLRLATESLVAKQTSEQSVESEEVTIWGVITLQT